jgi:hypothetical protein
MSKPVRALVLGVTLAAMNLAGVTAVAHASDELASSQDARQPPTERQVGESWRHRQLTADQPTTAAGDTLRPPTERQVGEPYRNQTGTPVAPEPSGQPGWLIASLGVLAAALALAGGLAVMAARRTSRRARVGHAA